MGRLWRFPLHVRQFHHAPSGIDRGGDRHPRHEPASDQMPLAKLKISPEERRRRTADRLIMIQLKNGDWPRARRAGITMPAEIGAALGMPPAEAT